LLARFASLFAQRNKKKQKKTRITITRKKKQLTLWQLVGRSLGSCERGITSGPTPPSFCSTSPIASPTAGCPCGTPVRSPSRQHALAFSSYKPECACAVVCACACACF
jgi:hypothetical protein